jgi:hypothetical protein
MGIKQLSAHWSGIEDRIFFSFNTEEGELFQFWITRAIARAILDRSQLVVEQELSNQHNERASKLISEFQKEGLKKQINFEETFEGGQSNPLGVEPILIATFEMRLEEDGVLIALTLVSNQVVRFRLIGAQLQALSLLIERLAVQAQWGIGEQEIVEIEAGQSALASNPSSQLH